MTPLYNNIYNVPTILLCIICSVFISGSKNWHRDLTYYITHFYGIGAYLLTYFFFDFFDFVYSTKSAVSPPHVIIMVHAYSVRRRTTGSPRIDINLNTVWHKCLLVMCGKIQTIRSKRGFEGGTIFISTVVFSKT